MRPAISSTRHPEAPHARFSVEEFHQLCEAVPERRLELIDGEVLEVIAKGTRHSTVVNRLARLIHMLLTPRPELVLELRVESPLDLGATSEPEPDLALVRFRGDDYLRAHPSAADTLLIIEVADSGLRFDLEGKASLYREAGIENYWVVDVLNSRLIVVAEGSPPVPPPIQPDEGNPERFHPVAVAKLPGGAGGFSGGVAAVESLLQALKAEAEALVAALPPA